MLAGGMSTIAGILMVAFPGTADADSSEPMQDCPPFAPMPIKEGVFDTIADDLAFPRGEWWCDASMPSGTTSYGSQGLTLAIPAYPTVGSTAWTNAEVVSRHQVQTGMSMSVRLAPMDLDGVQGSRGWGFWNGRFASSAGASAIAWFFYQDGTTCPGTQCPKGLFVQTQSLGNPDTKITFLPTSLLSRTHTYTVTLGRNAVDFYVDGARISRVTDPDYIPTTPMESHFWVDNNLYSMGPDQFTLAPQVTAVPTSMTGHWWWQGPTNRVPMGAKMVPGTRER